MVKSSVFSTSNTALAAFLAVSNIKLISLDIHVHPVVYHFESNGAIQDLIMQWESEVSAYRQFYNTYRSFIKRIKEKNV